MTAELEKFRVQRAADGWLVTVPPWARAEGPLRTTHTWHHRESFAEAIALVDCYVEIARLVAPQLGVRPGDSRIVLEPKARFPR
jgi:hypothetical protein